MSLFTYLVPELTPDGTCSAGTAVAAKPYDLRVTFEIQNQPKNQAYVASQIQNLRNQLRQVQSIVEADWIGIYQIVHKSDNTPILVKLVYQGETSRAEFPLSDEFALLSNNSKVGLTGEAVIIDDVTEHEGPYYTCDGRVRSEICLPIFNATGTEVVGIIDAESFTPRHFSQHRQVILKELCTQLAVMLPLRLSAI